MVFVLNQGLLGVLDKIEQANILNDSEIADLRALAMDCRLLETYGVDVHQLAQEKQQASRKALLHAVDDALYLFSDRTISNDLNDVPKLVEKRKKARATGEYLVYYSVTYIASVTGCTIYKAQQEYASRNNRTQENVKRQYLAQKHKLGIK